MLPEPRALRTERSIVPRHAEKTVLSPAREVARAPGIETYSKEDFQRVGLSPETFAQRAKKVADQLLATLKPDLIKGDKGQVLYAVYLSERPVMASLLIAPSLPRVFRELFGNELWIALPDRHALYVFPAKAAALEEFVADLEERYKGDPHAASPEVFSIKAGEELCVVAAFAE